MIKKRRIKTLKNKTSVWYESINGHTILQTFNIHARKNAFVSEKKTWVNFLILEFNHHTIENT